MNHFDMPIITARQVWHYITYTRSSGDLSERVDCSHVRKFPGYERGAKAAIDSLPNHLWFLGNFYWSAQVEGSEEARVFYYAQTTNFLQEHIDRLEKSEEWKGKARKLAKYAVMEVRHRNPPDMSATRPPLYTQTFLEERMGIGSRHFQRDAGEQWDYLTGQLESWVGQALKPLAKWVEQKRDAA